MALIEHVIDAAKQQVPKAFAVGSALPHFDSLQSAEPYAQPRATLDVTNNVLIPGMDDDPGDLEEAIAETGFEALAFYISFHKPTADGKWGIFYIGSRMRQLAEMIRRRLPLPDPQLALALAFSIVRRHETFHFRFDVYSLHQELTIGQPLYNAYHDTVYRNVFCTELCFEEALANRSVVRTRAQDWPEVGVPPSTISNFTKEFCETSPPGYRNFADPVQRLRAGLGGQLLRTRPDHSLPEPQSWWVGNAGPLARQSCPEMVMVTYSAGRSSELRLRRAGRIWDFHKYDADPWPSRPHGHDIEDGSKLSLEDGLIYDPTTRQVRGRESSKTILELRKRLERKWPDVELPPLTAAVSREA